MIPEEEKGHESISSRTMCCLTRLLKLCQVRFATDFRYILVKLMFSKNVTKFKVNLPYFFDVCNTTSTDVNVKTMYGIFFQILRPSWKTSTLVKKTSLKVMKEIFNKMWKTQK